MGDDEAGGRILIDDDPHPAVAHKLRKRWNGSYNDMFAATHIARHDPARVLREVEANRRLLDLHGQSEPDGHDGNGYRFACSHCDQTVPCASLRLLGAPYSDHPGWREEWAVPTS